jgi:branched-chain amino acid transport system substrate-binding protein
MAEIDWKALQIVANVSTSVRRGDEAGGFENGQGVLSAH